MSEAKEQAKRTMKRRGRERTTWNENLEKGSNNITVLIVKPI